MGSKHVSYDIGQIADMTLLDGKVVLKKANGFSLIKPSFNQAYSDAAAGDAIFFYGAHTLSAVLTKKDSVHIIGFGVKYSQLSYVASNTDVVLDAGENATYKDFRLNVSLASGSATGVRASATTNATATFRGVRVIGTGAGSIAPWNVTGTGVGVNTQPFAVQCTGLATGLGTGWNVNAASGTTVIRSCEVTGFGGYSLSAGHTLVDISCMFNGLASVNNGSRQTLGSSSAIESGSGVTTQPRSLSLVIPRNFIVVARGTPLTTGIKFTKYWDRFFTMMQLYAQITNPSTSGVVDIDIKKGGASIFTTRLTIDANENSSRTAATAWVLDGAVLPLSLWHPGMKMDIDIIATGVGSAGELAIEMYGQEYGLF